MRQRGALLGAALFLSAAARAADLPPPGVEISYEDVLNHPDDMDLNMRYAAQQVDRGELKSALSTCERMLLADPGQTRVRLAYAAILYRLDDMEEARRELETVLRSGADPAVLRDAREYLRRVEGRSQRTRLLGRVSAGFEYDSNRNASPTSGQSLFFGVPFNLNGTSLRRSDTAMIGAAGVEARRTLASQAGHELFAGLNYYRQEQTVVNTLDLQAYAVRAGAAIKGPGWILTPTGIYDQVLLAQKTYLSDAGGSLELRKLVNRRLSLFAEARDVYQGYRRTLDIPTGDERRGPELSGTLGVNWAMTPTMRLDGSFTHLIKRAGQSYDAYRREAVRVGHAWFMGRGAFLAESLILGYDCYQTADHIISDDRRIDRNAQADVTFGVPLSFLSGRFGDVLWTVSYEHYHDWSNVTNYAFYNNKVFTLLTYQWGVGR
ncbi:MAG TPA: tetratricopeptide repeat protein [Elusimicrobiota bacterium]|nr:tetratricopeptide repeat protein [Elusimicrobiota bacterium]